MQIIKKMFIFLKDNFDVFKYKSIQHKFNLSNIVQKLLLAVNLLDNHHNVWIQIIKSGSPNKSITSFIIGPRCLECEIIDSKKFPRVRFKL